MNPTSSRFIPGYSDDVCASFIGVTAAIGIPAAPYAWMKRTKYSAPA